MLQSRLKDVWVFYHYFNIPWWLEEHFLPEYNSRQQFERKIILELASAVYCGNTYKHPYHAYAWFNPSHSELQATQACLDILVLVSSGAQSCQRNSSVTCSAVRERQAERQAEKWPSGETGHMVESQTGWCSAAPCLCFQPQNLIRPHCRGWGRGLIEFGAELKLGIETV